MWELDYKENWAPKNWCVWTVVLEKTLESPLDCKEILPVHPKGDQSSVLIGRTDVEAEIPTLWPPDGKSWLICKDPDAGKDWEQEEKGTTEDEIVGWHHWLSGRGFGWSLGVGDGQEAWYAAVHVALKRQTRLSDWTEVFYCMDVPQFVSSSFCGHFSVFSFWLLQIKLLWTVLQVFVQAYIFLLVSSRVA